MANQNIQQITTEELADILEETTISGTVDLGTSLVHSGIHKSLGRVTVIATCGDRHAVVKPAV